MANLKMQYVKMTFLSHEQLDYKNNTLKAKLLNKSLGSTLLS